VEHKLIYVIIIATEHVKMLIVNNIKLPAETSNHT
jgi:hypothetical protein